MHKMNADEEQKEGAPERVSGVNNSISMAFFGQLDKTCHLSIRASAMTSGTARAAGDGKELVLTSPSLNDTSMLSMLYVDNSTSNEAKRNLRTRLEQHNLIDRSREESTLKQCCSFRESEDHSSIMIKGPSGSGKTRLANSLKVDMEHFGYFLAGKFDLCQQMQPYGVLNTALNDFVTTVMERSTVSDVRSACASALTADEAYALQSMIPAIKPLLTLTGDHLNGNEAKHFAPGSCDGVQRVALLLRKFLRAVCSPEHPIVLFLDDLQWADTCTLDAVLCLVVQRHSGLVTVLCSDDSSASPSAKSRLRKLERIAAVTIQLRNLDQGQVGQFVARALQCENPRDCQSLVDIVNQQTGGNLEYMKVFLNWLLDSNLLCFNSSAGWDWETEKILAETTVASDLPDFIGRQLQASLNPQIIEVLMVGACLGSCCLDERLIRCIVGYPVDQYLCQGCTQGYLVVRKDGAYAFAHGSVQKAAYRLVSKQERESFHLEVARRLLERLDEAELDGNLFMVLSLFSKGQRSITLDKERVRIATLCLQAAVKKAKEMSHFRSAGLCLEFGMDLLGEQGWSEDYGLTLALHNWAIEMNMCTANFERMNQRVEQVLIHSKTLLDQIQALGCRIYVLGVTDRQQEAIDLGSDILRSLGESFPRSFLTAHILKEMLIVRRLLKGRSDEQLMRMPQIDDQKKLACLQILHLMFSNCLLLRRKLAPLVTLKMMKITLINGLSTYSSLAFSMYGMHLLFCGDLDGACRFGKLGLKSLESSGTLEYLPRVYAAYYAVIFPWKYPMRDALEPLLRAHRIGLQTGDLEFAYLCSNCYCFLALDCSVPLDVLLQHWSVFKETMVSHRQTTLLAMALPFMQLMLFYMDPCLDPLSYKGDVVDMVREKEVAEQMGLESRSNEIQICCLMIAYEFGAYKEAEKWLDGIDDICKRLPSVQKISLCFYKGLTCLALASLGRERRRNLKAAKKTIHQIRTWSIKTPHNCLDKRLLLEAELAFVCGFHEKAYELYVSAVAMAKDLGVLQVRALANERCAYHLCARGRRYEARPFFEEACIVYDEWGAKAKRVRLEREMETLCKMIEPSS